jgi:hypothetical protein
MSSRIATALNDSRFAYSGDNMKSVIPSSAAIGALSPVPENTLPGTADHAATGNQHAASKHGAASIAARMERLPSAAYFWKIIVLVSLGGWFEFYDLIFTGYIAPGLAASGLLTTTTATFFGYTGIGGFIAATFAGLFVGTFFCGRLADRYGRRAAFTWSMVWYSVASAFMAFQTTPEGLLIWRFVAGIGLGVEIVTVTTYIVELVPSHMRGKAIAFNQAIMFTAAPIAALLAHWLVPQTPFGIDGWRWVVLLGSTGAIVVVFIRSALPETPRWLVQNGRADEAERVVAGIETTVAKQSGRPLPEPVLKVEMPTPKAVLSHISERNVPDPYPSPRCRRGVFVQPSRGHVLRLPDCLPAARLRCQRGLRHDRRLDGRCHDCHRRLWSDHERQVAGRAFALTKG